MAPDQLQGIDDARKEKRSEIDKWRDRAEAAETTLAKVTEMPSRVGDRLHKIALRLDVETGRMIPPQLDNGEWVTDRMVMKVLHEEMQAARSQNHNERSEGENKRHHSPSSTVRWYTTPHELRELAKEMELRWKASFVGDSKLVRRFIVDKFELRVLIDQDKISCHEASDSAERGRNQ